MGRKAIPLETQTGVLTLSGRRCAFCFGLDKDESEKAGQIAHVDRDSSNNHIQNLAFLCLEHHDKYDTRTSQSKGYTEGELLSYREALYCKRDPKREIERGGEMYDDYDEYAPLIPPKWLHFYKEALSFHAGPHRTQSAVITLIDGDKSLEEINSGIPPCDLKWTKDILEGTIESGWVKQLSDGRFRLAVGGKTLLECLEALPNAVKEDAWRKNWFPDSA